MQPRYVSNARSKTELHAEFLSDIQRRLDDLDKYLRNQVRSATESSRIARARNELLDLQDYWYHVELATDEETH